MTSQPGLQTIPIHILPNISYIKYIKIYIYQIWSIDRTEEEKYFSLKSMPKMRQGD